MSYARPNNYKYRLYLEYSFRKNTLWYNWSQQKIYFGWNDIGAKSRFSDFDKKLL